MESKAYTPQTLVEMVHLPEFETEFYASRHDQVAILSSIFNVSRRLDERLRNEIVNHSFNIDTRENEIEVDMMRVYNKLNVDVAVYVHNVNLSYNDYAAILSSMLGYEYEIVQCECRNGNIETLQFYEKMRGFNGDLFKDRIAETSRQFMLHEDALDAVRYIFKWQSYKGFCGPFGAWKGEHFIAMPMDLKNKVESNMMTPIVCNIFYVLESFQIRSAYLKFLETVNHSLTRDNVDYMKLLDIYHPRAMLSNMYEDPEICLLADLLGRVHNQYQRGLVHDPNGIKSTEYHMLLIMNNVMHKSQFSASIAHDKKDEFVNKLGTLIMKAVCANCGWIDGYIQKARYHRKQACLLRLANEPDLDAISQHEKLALDYESEASVLSGFFQGNPRHPFWVFVDDLDDNLVRVEIRVNYFFLVRAVASRPTGEPEIGQNLVDHIQKVEKVSFTVPTMKESGNRCLWDYPILLYSVKMFTPDKNRIYITLENPSFAARLYTVFHHVGFTDRVCIEDDIPDESMVLECMLFMEMKSPVEDLYAQTHRGNAAIRKLMRISAERDPVPYVHEFVHEQLENPVMGVNSSVAEICPLPVIYLFKHGFGRYVDDQLLQKCQNGLKYGRGMFAYDTTSLCQEGFVLIPEFDKYPEIRDFALNLMTLTSLPEDLDNVVAQCLIMCGSEETSIPLKALLGHIVVEFGKHQIRSGSQITEDIVSLVVSIIRSRFYGIVDTVNKLIETDTEPLQQYFSDMIASHGTVIQQSLESLIKAYFIDIVLGGHDLDDVASKLNTIASIVPSSVNINNAIGAAFETLMLKAKELLPSPVFTKSEQMARISPRYMVIGQSYSFMVFSANIIRNLATHFKTVMKCTNGSLYAIIVEGCATVSSEYERHCISCNQTPLEAIDFYDNAIAAYVSRRFKQYHYVSLASVQFKSV